MRIIITAKSAAAKAGVLVTPVFSDQLDAPHLREADSKSGGRIAALRAIGEGTGSRYSCTLTSAGQRAASPDAKSHDSPLMPPASSLR